MNDLLWSEEYRPKTIKECILPSEISDTFEQIVKQGSIPNMLLSGSSGRGKTTVARALCNELNADYILINGSEDSGIDVLRTKIRQFASTHSLMGDTHKVVILDEADYLNSSSTQPALRAFIEEFSGNCRFILTCNYRNKIIDALKSRCTCIDFTTTKKSMSELAASFHKRMCKILKENDVKYDPKIVAELILRFAPDWRRVINECQRYSVGGELSAAALSSLSDENIDTLITFLKSKNFKDMRKWVASNSDLDAITIYRKIYDTLTEYADPQSIPQAILIIAEYQYKDAFVVDHEINTVAALTELMSSVKWK
ncbi:MAG: AAA family ATPase [Bacteroidota bacterium]